MNQFFVLEKNNFFLIIPIKFFRSAQVLSRVCRVTANQHFFKTSLTQTWASSKLRGICSNNNLTNPFGTNFIFDVFFKNFDLLPFLEPVTTCDYVLNWWDQSFSSLHQPCHVLYQGTILLVSYTNFETTLKHFDINSNCKRLHLKVYMKEC